MKRMRPRGLLVLVSTAWLCFAPIASAMDPSSFTAADPKAPAVTVESLVSSERFWPYQVELTTAWKPEGRDAPLAAGTRGVLVRVGTSGTARIDFGRNGRFEVPIAKTDLVERANQVRLGELAKPAPHFVHTIGTRLVDSGSEKIRFVNLADVYVPRGFLAVFADPDAEGFAKLAAELAPLRESDGVMTVLFPQGHHPDVKTRDALRAAKWPVAFLRDEYGEGYTRSIRGEGTPMPAVMLLTPEGRVLFDQPWGNGVTQSLQAVVQKEFGATGAATAGAEHPAKP